MMMIKLLLLWVWQQVTRGPWSDGGFGDDGEDDDDDDDDDDDQGIEVITGGCGTTWSACCGHWHWILEPPG